MEPASKGIRWRFPGRAPDPALLEASARAPEKAEILKESPLRQVCRVRAGDLSALVKIHPPRGPLSRLAALLGIDRADREARALLAARQRGLPAPAPLALGRSPGGACRLLLEDLGEGPTLADLLGKGRPTRAQLLATAGLVAHLHRAGLRHPDLHPGNLLFPKEGPAPFLLDLQSARLGRGPLPARLRKKSLVFLWLSGRRRLSPLAGLVFLRAYLAVLPWPKETKLLSLARTLEEAAGKLERKIWVRREDRPFRTCSEFQVLPLPGGKAIQARTKEAPTPGEIRALLEEGEVRFLRRGRRGFVARGGGWVLKERDERHARALWLAHYRLLQRGIPGPRALLLTLREGRGLLVTRDLGPLPDLARAFREAPSQERREALLQAAGTLPARLHAGGLRNRDLKAANLLVRESPSGPVLLPVDLDGLARPRRLGLGHRAADLARLAASLLALDLPWEKLLQAYLDALPPGKDRLDPAALRARTALRLARLGPRP